MNIALITARGGSKGLPRKNILTLNGLPLIGWTINAALNSIYINRVFVSTEDEEIASISKNFGADVIHRPLELATDTSGSEAVISHSIDYLGKQGIFPKNICLLQPTSPLRSSSHIDAAFEEFELKSANCVLSVFEPKYSASKAYKVMDDGTISGLLNESAPYCRRQDLPKAYQPNGAIYLFPASEFMKKHRIPRNNVYPFIMSEKESIDIDTAADMKDVEIIINGED